MAKAHAEAAESDLIVTILLLWIHIYTFVVNSEFIQGHSVQKWQPKFQNFNFTQINKDYPGNS